MDTTEDPRRMLMAAALGEIQRRTELLQRLGGLDEEIARGALELFATPASAAEWLLLESHAGLGGRCILDVAQSPKGRAEAIAYIAGISHGNFQ